MTRYCRPSACLALLLFATAPREAAAQSPVEGLDELLAIEVSSASHVVRTAQRAPGSVTVITAEQIERYGYRTLAEALASVPGLYLTYDHNYSYLGVRGYSRPTDYNNRVLVLLDGYRLNEDVYGYAPIGTDLALDLRSVERIEIVRGPGSAMYGTAAMLAVVNVILHDPATTSRSRVAVEGGTQGSGGATVELGFRGRSGIAAAGSLTGSRSEGSDFLLAATDLRPQEVVVRGGDQDEGWGFAGTATWRDLAVTAFGSSRNKGFPTAAFETVPGDVDAETTDRWRLVGLRWRKELRHGLSLTARAQTGEYEYEGVYPYEEYDYLDATDNHWWGADLQVRWETSARHQLTLGGELRDNRRADYRAFDGEGTSFFAADRPYRVRSFFLEDDLQLGEHLLLTVGARHDLSTDEADSVTSPRLALVYLPDARSSVKLLYGRAFRAPNLYEKWYEDAETDAKSNPELSGERVESVEVAATRRIGTPFLVGVSIYRSRFTDLIEQWEDPADGLDQHRNVGGATAVGGELEITAEWARGASAFASYSLQRSEDEESGERLSNSPGYLLKAGASGRFWQRLRGGVELTYEGGRRTVDGGATDGFLLANGLLAWRLTDRLSLELRARNLFDNEYSLPGGWEHDPTALPQRGRSVALRLERRF
jgi:iron complex outermembrane receptor protein